jgi:uncharacterized protein
MTAAKAAIASPTVSQFVLKVHSRCDLACDHCYVYEHADQSWRVKPRAISAETVDFAARRIAEHAVTHRLPLIRIVLHGGEPLLLGRNAMRDVLATLTGRIAQVTRLDLRIHTNGVRLDEPWLELFRDYQVRVGVSLDGDQAANDRHRRFADGRSSHAQVLRALALLRQPRHRRLYAGILCTIDIANDPEGVYRALLEQKPPRVDLLLPHATWDSPPARPAGVLHPYADWLLRLYRCWISDGRPVPIRLFDSVLSAAHGGPSFTEAIGLDPVDLLVIDTDGAWEQADSLKTAFDGAPRTGMGVRTHSVDEAAQHTGLAARRGGLAALCATCRDCPVVRICGGGMYAHRYKSGTGFANPSVYCLDLKELIEQIAAHGHEVTVAAASESPSQSVRQPVHQLPSGAFEALAAGPGTVAAVTCFAQLRLSQNRALVAAVAAMPPAGRDPMLAAAAAEGWSIFCTLDNSHPSAVADTLAHPYIRAWAMRCLYPPRGADPEADRAQLAGLAAAAALRAEVQAELPVPVRAGLAYIPSLGALDVGASAGSTVRVVIDPTRHRLGTGTEFTWRTVRHVTGHQLPLAVEDLDPLRDCQLWPAAGRLTRPQWLEWQRALTAAGRRMAHKIPLYARVLAAGLRTVVPLRAGPAEMRSATSRHAFGAVALSLPTGPDALNRVEDMLVHEFQHAKLFVLSDLYNLVDAASPYRLRVPWRDDPRPPEGVLHGIYAHLALAHLSRSRGQAERAAWLRYQSWVRETCDALWETKALTPDGERFVTGMLVAVEDDAPTVSLVGSGKVADGG